MVTAAPSELADGDQQATLMVATAPSESADGDQHEASVHNFAIAIIESPEVRTGPPKPLATRSPQALMGPCPRQMVSDTVFGYP